MPSNNSTNSNNSPSPHAVEIRDLRVDYGEFVAVNDLSLNIPYGEVYGIVGPNGAGKTSTFKVLATLMEPTYGEIKLAGYDILEQTKEVRRVLGYMPDLAPVPSDLKLCEFLEFHAHTHAPSEGLRTKAERSARVTECLELVNLHDKRNDWCKKLSRGQTQRLVLAKTLLHRPKILILDEPASGLDPLSRREMRHVLQKLAQQGSTVLVSSHILTELAEMCSSICIMNQGKILASGTAEEVRREMGRAERKLSLVLTTQKKEATTWLETQEHVSKIEDKNTHLEFVYRGSEDEQIALLAQLIHTGFPVKLFEEKESSFEEILVEVAEANLQN